MLAVLSVLLAFTLSITNIQAQSRGRSGGGGGGGMSRPSGGGSFGGSRSSGSGRGGSFGGPYRPSTGSNSGSNRTYRPNSNGNTRETRTYRPNSGSNSGSSTQGQTRRTYFNQTHNGETTIRYRNSQSAATPRSRTDVVNRSGGRRYTRHHDVTVVHHVTVYRYQPTYYYHHHYYRYCTSRLYDPWFYDWHWYSYPSAYSWYGYYGYYYSPWRTYYYPTYWMTDYILADTLAYRYEQLREDERQLARDRAALEAEKRQISEEMKVQIATQVEAELNARAEKQTVSLERKLADPKHIFAISQSIQVLPVGENAIACTLNAGDLVKLAGSAPLENETSAIMQVVSSQVGSCAAGSTVLISIQTLQEFENEFNARVDDAAEQLSEDPELSRKINVKTKRKKSKFASEEEEETDDMYPPKR